MKITILGNIVALGGFVAGMVLADISDAAVWQTLIAGAIWAIAFIVIVPGATGK